MKKKKKTTLLYSYITIYKLYITIYASKCFKESASRVYKILKKHNRETHSEQYLEKKSIKESISK